MVIVNRFQVLLEGNYLPAFDLKIFGHNHASLLPEAVEKNLNNLEKLVDQFLWISTSLGNQLCVLRALKLVVRLLVERRESGTTKKC